MIDPQVNFFSSTLVGTYSASDTSLTIATGSGQRLPDPSVDGAFNLVIYNESAIGVVTTYDGGSTDTRQDLAGTSPEIVRVTARSGDVLTVTRGQEGTTASVKEEGNTYRVILSATKKVFDDIQTAIDNVNVTNLTGVESLVFDTTGDEEFGLPVGTTAQRPASPSAGYMRWNSTDSRIEFYNGTRWAGLSEIGLQQETMEVAQLSVTANDAVAENVIPLEVEYLVIAGGGGGGLLGGGGAGGYRTSTGTQLELSTNYTVTVGGGGAGTSAAQTGNKGSTSTFSTISSTGGGGGAWDNYNAGSGGSGGGASSIDGVHGTLGSGNEGSFTPSEGNDGGTYVSTPGSPSGNGNGAGGGGASEDGQNSQSINAGGDGGDGLSSSITGSAVTRAGGGGGGAYDFGSTGTAGVGGAGGGGNGGRNGLSATNGTANTGGGGGGCGLDSTGNLPGGAGSGAGGSGVVILRYPSDFTISIGAGLTGSTTTVGANKVTTFTAGTDTISFS